MLGAVPYAARAQPRATPVVGLLFSTGMANLQRWAVKIREGLGAEGFVDGESVMIAGRAVEGNYDQIPRLVTELIELKATVILAAGGTEPARIAKAATTSIPIVFFSAADPVKAGLVTSLNRPGGNVTGISMLGAGLEGKRLELLQQLVPGNAPFAAMVNPNYPDADRQERDVREAADILKRGIEVVHARSDAEIESAFARVMERHAAGLLVAQDIFYATRREAIISLAARHKLPAIYQQREFVDVGGLMSYGTDFAAGYRQAGMYLGRILKGEKPADLPVVQPSKFEFVFNMKTAKTLELDPPALLLAAADEMIE